MRRLVLRPLLAMLALTTLPAAAAGAGKAPRLWNPDTVATVTGTVEAVERIEMGEAWRCVRLRLRTADGLLQIRVAPDWWVAERKLAFAAGQTLDVKGSRVTFSGEPAVVAGEIVRGGERIVLRDAAGKAAWTK
ncbi:MAG TPA: hypothetical protein VLT47_08350 [Anaeromyxobacteraceae bacterium]|nr:hypothetical protein [Anaeromyxobacteraceae bacterium]